MSFDVSTLRAPERRYLVGMLTGRSGMCRESYRKPLIARGLIGVQRRGTDSEWWFLTVVGHDVACACARAEARSKQDRSPEDV